MIDDAVERNLAAMDQLDFEGWNREPHGHRGAVEGRRDRRGVHLDVVDDTPNAAGRAQARSILY